MTTSELLKTWATLTSSLPNAEQRSVMEHEQGPLWIIAGPGTGKSYALILRCLVLLCVRRVPPEAIVLTTFTKKVAAELEQRLQEALLLLGTVYPEVKTIDLSRMHLGTMHSLCWTILTETPNSPYRHLQILTQLDEAFFAYTRSRFCQNQHSEETTKLLIELVNWAGDVTYTKLPPRWKRTKLFLTMYERIVHDHIDRAGFASSSPAFALLIELIDEYEQALSSSRFTNQTLMIQQALEILASPEGRFQIQQLQAIFVDEFQDTNPLQASFYRALASCPPYNLCVVGDDDQAMYRFRGGTVGGMVRFPEECQRVWPDCTVHRLALTETYRSHELIIQWINAYITLHPEMALPNARVQEKGTLRGQPSDTPNAPVVWVIRGKTAKETAQHFVDLLDDLKTQHIIESYAQCALLARSVKPNKKAGSYPYIQALLAKEIPLSIDSSPKDHPVYKYVLGIMLLVLDRAQNLMPPNFAEYNASLATYVEECRQMASAHPILAPMVPQIRTWLFEEQAANQYSLTQLAHVLLNTPPCFQALISDPKAEKAARTLLQTLDAFDRIVHHGFQNIQVEEVAGKRRPKKQWMDRFYYVLIEAIQQAHFEREDQSPDQIETEAMHVMTVHASKGLEFPLVAVVVEKTSKGYPDESHRMEQDVLPFRLDLAESSFSPTLPLGGEPEDRAAQDVIRRHYVAYSRAQKVLFLLVSDDHLKEPPVLGLGMDGETLSTQLPIWPVKKTSRTKQKSVKGNEGAQQHELWG